MGSKYDALRYLILEAVENLAKEIHQKGGSIRSLLAHLSSDTSNMFYQKISKSLSTGISLTLWDIKPASLEKLIDKTGYIIVPVLIHKDDHETIEKLEQITAENYDKFMEVLDQIKQEILSKPRSRTQSQQKSKVRNIEIDNEYLEKIKQLRKSRLNNQDQNNNQQATVNNTESSELDDIL